MVAIAGVEGVRRVRLSSVEVIHVKDSLIRALASEPKVCPHLHLPLQSGDDEVLRAMGRHYSAAEYLEHVAALRAAVPEVNLTTDVIVGFPTEDERAFARTLAVVDAAGISRVHTFSYSPRPGTVAEGLGDLVAPQEKKRRSQVLRGHSEARSRRHRAAKLGRREQVLIDKVADSQCSGYTADYTRCYLPAGAGGARRAGRGRSSRAPSRRNRLRSSGRRRAILSGVTVTEQVRTDMTGAMKAGEKQRVGALRLVLSELQKEAKEGAGDELAVLRRERKRRLDAAEQFRQGGRPELAEQEESEAEIIEGYLPAELDDAELAQIVAAAIAETGAREPKDMGQVMKVVMARTEGRADGKRASRAGARGVECVEQLELDNTVAAELAGSKDAVLKTLEGHLDCDVFLRGNVLTLEGEEAAVDAAAPVVRELSELIAQGHEIAPGRSRP